MCCLLTLGRLLVGRFHNMLLMLVTTVVSVTQKKYNFISENRRKQLLRTLFASYNIIHPNTHHHDPCATHHNNFNLQNAIADAYEAPTENVFCLDESSYYTPYSITTSSSTPRYAPEIPSPHSTLTTNNKTQHPTRTEHFPHRQFLDCYVFPQFRTHPTAICAPRQRESHSAERRWRPYCH